MRLLLITLLFFVTVAFKSNVGIITLSGYSSGGNAIIEWSYPPEYTWQSFDVQRQENAGNLKNYFTTIATISGTEYQAIIPLIKGKNTFRVVGHGDVNNSGLYASNVYTVH